MGPLEGLRIVEFGGKGPTQFCGMLLADLGAEVIRIDRPGTSPNRMLGRGRRSVLLDAKTEGGVAVVRTLTKRSNGVIEGFRPGVIERLGLGPEVLLAERPDLVIGRMTGWGQDGPWADAPGHDINYLSVTGALHAIGPRGGAPVPPLNLVADMGGGGMLLALGLMAALWEARSTGIGQVVDAAMVDGVGLLMTLIYGFYAEGTWVDERGSNRLDGGRPWYGVYPCRDGYLAVGCVEPKFWAEFIGTLGLANDPLFATQNDPAAWEPMTAKITSILGGRSRSEWETVFPNGRACVTPVLRMCEVQEAPHNKARQAFVGRSGGRYWANAAPRFSRTALATPGEIPELGGDTSAVLSECGYSASEIADLVAAPK